MAHPITMLTRKQMRWVVDHKGHIITTYVVLWITIIGFLTVIQYVNT